MKRFSGLAVGLILSVVSVFATGNWRMHPSFNDKVNHVVETPDFVYFTSRTLAESDKRDNYYNLFRYDKQGDEIQNLSTDNVLAFNTIEEIQYNPSKKYLVVVYSNSDIDFLYDNGEIVNIPTYMLAQMSSSKKVNGISIDADNDKVYLATEFGYVALNDKKGEIYESRNYDVPFKSYARSGDKFLAIFDNKLHYADAGHERMSLTDYNPIDFEADPTAIYPLDNGLNLLVSGDGNNRGLWILDVSEDSPQIKFIGEGQFYNIENNYHGVSVGSPTTLVQFYKSGQFREIPRPSAYYRQSVSSYNLTEIWHGIERKGLSSGKSNDGNWTLTRDYMLPDAPAMFYSASMEMHPSRGLLVCSYGDNFIFNERYSHSTKELVSGYANGRWIQYSPEYTNPSQSGVMFAPVGMAVDPDNRDYLYLTSKMNGIVRLNLSDPDDVIHLSSPSDGARNLDGFFVLVPDQKGEYAGTTHFSPPKFDYYGNMWTSYADYDNQTPEKLVLYCWKKEDRKNASPNGNFNLPTRIEIPGYKTSNSEELLPLKVSGQRNLMVYAYKRYDEFLLVIDTGGTPEDTSDDKVKAIKTFYDQDGNVVDVHYIYTIYEDPSTGYVWVGHLNGVFYFNPSDVIKGADNVYRVKVSRNDGTNLADYLLNGVTVYDIISDNQGRKWFATSGGGIVCTSSDGREILQEYNTENSQIPSDIVYTLGYNTDNNSIMMSTSEGLAEYFLSGSPSAASGKDELKIYPNPVRPDYLGYVTIEGVPSGSLVKVTDSAGNMVKELGLSSGDVKWDVTNHRFQRVNSGVYYIFASPGGESSGDVLKGKVLVVN